MTEQPVVLAASALATCVGQDLGERDRSLADDALGAFGAAREHYSTLVAVFSADAARPSPQRNSMI